MNMSKIKIVNLTKQFNGKGRFMTDELNLDIPEGKLTCIIGRSGEGKSVLLKQIIGLIEPTSGSIYVDGKETVGLTGQDRINNFKKFFIEMKNNFNFDKK